MAREDGLPLHLDAVTRAFGNLVARADLPQISFHGLRHSHATQLLRAMVHPKIVSERLGHSGIGITLDLYSHVLPGMQEEAAQRFDQVFRHAMGEESR